ncbi:alpha/beta hydrolase fold domain-containing protein, partial [Streptococcus pyogenes]
LSLSDVRSYAALYWGDAPPPRATVPLAAARFDRLPPVLAIAAEYDPLYDDARVYVERIRAAGGTAHLLTGRGLVHGFWRSLDTS